MAKDDKRQEWRTPFDFCGVLDGEFDFELDAAATIQNAIVAKYITPEMDALDPKTRWVGRGAYGDCKITRVYCNPGFSFLMPWMQRAYEEAQRLPNAVVAVMGVISPSANSDKKGWWNKWAVKASEIRLLCPRPEFIAAPGIKQSRNPRENCLVIFRRRPINPPPAVIWTWRWKE